MANTFMHDHKPEPIRGTRYRSGTIKVAVVSLDGSKPVFVPASELMDLISDGGQFVVEIRDIPRRDFEAMPEFVGW